jgi:GntR family transcriptional regulator
MLINRQSPLPLYLQLAEILRAKIETGEYPPGTKIPSEPELAKSYRMGRPTIRQALGLLVQEGNLLKRKGAGTFVREKAPEIDLFSLAGTSSAFRQKGLALTQRVLEKTARVTVGKDPANPFAGREAYFFSRLSLHQAEPILLEETYLDPALFPGIDRYDFARESLARIVKDRYYLNPCSCRQSFRVTNDRERGTLLDLPRGRPPLEVSRTINFPDHPAGIFSLLFCRTDRFVFSQTIGGADDA